MWGQPPSAVLFCLCGDACVGTGTPARPCRAKLDSLSRRYHPSRPIKSTVASVRTAIALSHSARGVVYGWLPHPNDRENTITKECAHVPIPHPASSRPRSFRYIAPTGRVFTHEGSPANSSGSSPAKENPLYWDARSESRSARPHPNTETLRFFWSSPHESSSRPLRKRQVGSEAMGSSQGRPKPSRHQDPRQRPLLHRRPPHAPPRC